MRRNHGSFASLELLGTIIGEHRSSYSVIFRSARSTKDTDFCYEASRLGVTIAANDVCCAISLVTDKSECVWAR